MHGKEFSCLDVSVFCLLRWPADDPNRVSDDRYCVVVDSPDLVLPVQLTPQDKPYSLQLFGCGFPRGLFVFPIFLWDSQVLVAVHNVCSTDFW